LESKASLHWGLIHISVSNRYKESETEKVSSLQRHIWNLKNDWYDGFLRNAFKSIIKEEDMIIDTSTGEVLEFL
jgi:hypothetical protein